MNQVRTPHGDVTVAVDGPGVAAGTVVLAPGAGGGLRSDFMEKVAAGLASEGWRVARFNFPYAEAGRKSPDKQPVLEGAYRAVADAIREGQERLVIGGKSMGGRIASHIAAAGYDCDGLLFLGYPLHPPGRPERIRDRHLYDITVPMLFVEGTRDPFCPLETLERVRARLKAPAEVAVIDDGDHSFKVRKSSGRSTEEAWSEVVTRASRWLAALLHPAHER